MRQVLCAIALSAMTFPLALAADPPLPSWNEGPARTAILDFVQHVTTQGDAEFVPADQRIAVFDNDGTLWCEQPLYVQFVFALDRVKVLAPEHPEWKTKEPFASILQGKVEAALAGGEPAVAAIVAATHADLTVEQFAAIVSDWLATTQDPRFKRPYTECVYQPMLEVLSHLRANGFKTFIVSRGGAEFMRPWTEQVYGIPPEQVVGSRGKMKFELRTDGPVLLKLPEIDLVDDGPGKPVGIQQQIGRRPIAAFGNSDGDLQMLQWTTMTTGRRLGMIVHHTDAEREYAYDRKSHVGRLDKALDQAPERGWTVIDMKSDWKTIFPPAK